MSISGKIVANITGKIVMDITEAPQGGPKYGPELVTNGVFDSDIAGWAVTDGSTSTIEWVSGAMRCIRNNQPVAETTLSEPLVSSKSYKLSFNVVSTSNAAVGTVYFTVAGYAMPTSGGTAVGSHEFTIEPASTGSKLALLAGGVGGLDFTIDNVSVREIL